MEIRHCRSDAVISSFQWVPSRSIPSVRGSRTYDLPMVNIPEPAQVKTVSSARNAGIGAIVRDGDCEATEKGVLNAAG